jgi:hypothetical protein
MTGVVDTDDTAGSRGHLKQVWNAALLKNRSGFTCFLTIYSSLTSLPSRVRFRPISEWVTSYSDFS